MLAAIADGKQLRDQGRLSEAVAAFTRGLNLAKTRHDQEGETKCLIMLGVGKTTNFEYRAALESLQNARELAEHLHDPLLAGSASGNMATVYAQVGDWPSADAASAQSVALLRHVPTLESRGKAFLARGLQSHADICFHLGKTSEGYKDSDEALSLAETAGNLSLQAIILDMRGAAFTREGKIAEADNALRRALSLSEKLQDPDDLAFVKEHLAELELAKPNADWHKALQRLDEAIATHSLLFKSSREYYPINIRGKILELSGNRPAALSEYLRAVNVAHQWRADALPGDTTSTLTVAALQQVYADYSHLAAKMALESNDNSLAISALAVLAENRAASLREQLRAAYSESGRLSSEYFVKLSELQTAQAEVTLGKDKEEDKAKLAGIRQDISNLENRIGIKPEKILSINEKNAGRNSLRNIQRTLGRDQVLLSISLGKAQSYLWAVTGDRINLLRLPSGAELQSKATRFASAVRRGDDSTPASDELSRALFQGLPPDTWNRSEWMLVADGPLLSGIPFCALRNLESEKSRQPLIDGRSIRFLASELLLLDRKADLVNKNFVGIGDPIYNSADTRRVPPRLTDGKTLLMNVTLARLAGSGREIRSAAAAAHSTDPILLMGATATSESLDAALAKQAAIVHFAVHVVSPPDQPQQAALALSLRNGMPELLTPEIVASFHTPGSLVVLSGCSSGQGKIVPGAGLVGLSRAWLLAGAAAVVVSNWPTPDDSGKFFSSFYSHFDQIKSGDTAQRAALALGRTQLDLSRGKGYQASPAFWGAFSVISKE